MKQAAKQSPAVKQEQQKAADADSDSDVEIVEEDAPEKGSLSGFYRAIRETGRANVLLALQVSLQTACSGDAPTIAPMIAEGILSSNCPVDHRLGHSDMCCCWHAGAKHHSSAFPADATRNRALGQNHRRH